MEYITGFGAVGVIAFLGAVSPGPDFVVVTKNTLLGSRAAGIWTALGVGTGILVHVAYSIVGIGLLVSQSPVLFDAVKLAGAAYLAYLGWQLLRAVPAAGAAECGAPGTVPLAAAFRNGFFTNALNPKATLFFLCVFTQVTAPTTPLWIRIAYGLEIAVIVGLWFVAVAWVLSIPGIHDRFARIQNGTAKVMGVVLIAFGLRLAWTHFN